MSKIMGKEQRSFNYRHKSREKERGYKEEVEEGSTHRRFRKLLTYLPTYLEFGHGLQIKFEPFQVDDEDGG